MRLYTDKNGLTLQKQGADFCAWASSNKKITDKSIKVAADDLGVAYVAVQKDVFKVKASAVLR